MSRTRRVWRVWWVSSALRNSLSRFSFSCSIVPLLQTDSPNSSNPPPSSLGVADSGPLDPTNRPQRPHDLRAPDKQCRFSAPELQPSSCVMTRRAEGPETSPLGRPQCGSSRTKAPILPTGRKVLWISDLPHRRDVIRRSDNPRGWVRKLGFCTDRYPSTPTAAPDPLVPFVR